MSDEKLELGKIAFYALRCATPYKPTPEYEFNGWPCGDCEPCMEQQRRQDACHNGIPGESPVLSVAQVREAVEQVLMPWDEPHLQPIPYNDGVNALARALLALAPDAPLPWEGE